MAAADGARPDDPGELIFYQDDSGGSRIQLRLHEGTVWLSQRLLAELYQVSVPTINEHLQTVYDDGEVAPEATIRKFRIVQTEGDRQVSRLVDHYRLEAILAVGYRVRSARGVAFRRWATTTLQEYLVKGFVLDDRRLKEGPTLGADYFDELLERIRDIRASEKRFYQKVRDLYALSVDYDKDVEQTRQFFQTVQNKLHWAVSGRTAAEIIRERADASKPNMGLTSWSGEKVRKRDVATAKNYLTQEEVDELNRVVVMYLDYAESQARKRCPLYMSDWAKKLDAFLQFNEHDLLDHKGRVSMEVAKSLAESEYDTFHLRRLESEAEPSDANAVDDLRAETDDVRRRSESAEENEDPAPEEGG